MHAETSLDRSLWMIALTIVVAIVAVSFAREPLLRPDGAVPDAAPRMTLWVATGQDDDGQTQSIAQRLASWWGMRGRDASVGVLSGSSAEAVREFLQRVHGTSNQLLVLTSSTLADLAREALAPPGSSAHERAQRTERLLSHAHPIGLIASDPVTLAVRSDSAPPDARQLLASLKAQPGRPLLSVADNAWLEDELAALAQADGPPGELPFSAFRSSREAVLSLLSSGHVAVLAPHSALAADLHTGRLRSLPWRSSEASIGEPATWVALLAPAGLPASSVAQLHLQALALQRDRAWRGWLRQQGLQPPPASARHSLPSGPIGAGLREAGRLQTVATRLLRSY